MAKKKKDKEKPDVNPELGDFELKVNEFGEIETNYDIDKINEFLNENVEDKKLKDRDDLKKKEDEDEKKDKD